MLVEATGRRGRSARWHRHLYDDKTFHIFESEITLWCGDQTNPILRGSAGDTPLPSPAGSATTPAGPPDMVRRTARPRWPTPPKNGLGILGPRQARRGPHSVCPLAVVLPRIAGLHHCPGRTSTLDENNLGAYFVHQIAQIEFALGRKEKRRGG
jgi:hypothetical protein